MLRKIIALFVIVISFYTQAQNNFENGVSPSSYRFFEQDKINSGTYNHIIYMSEDMSAINYFGNPLTDIDGDGKTDVMMRINEYLEGDWDLPSANPRLSVLGKFDKNLNFSLEKSNVIIADGDQYKFHSDESGDYYYQFTYQDFTRVDQFGLKDWKSYYDKFGFVENVDYSIYDGTPQLVVFNFRIYRKKNGVVEDVTTQKRVFSSEILNSTAKVFWQLAITPGDFDGDGDVDFLVFGEPFQQQTQNLTTFIGNRYQPYFIENIGNGSLKVNLYSYNPSQDSKFTLQEGTYGYASNFDGDIAQEAILEMTFGTPPNGNVTRNRELGYFDIDKNAREVRFTKLLDKSIYLFTDNTNVGPRFIQKLEIDKNRDLLLIFNTDQAGSPFSKIEGETNFTDGTIKQYFKVFEKTFDANKNSKLTDVTTEFFNLEESKTLSLDNAGTISQVDVDADGLLDIFVQLGQTPNSYMGGIKQFVKYPSWNGKANTMYYFKQTKDKKFKLTDLYEVPSIYFPNKFNQDYSLFDDNGYTNSLNSKDVSVSDFTFLNTFSLNDLDQDGNLEYISATDPSFLSVFTKSKVKLAAEVSKIKMADFSVISDKWGKGLDGMYAFDNLKYTFPVDTIYLNLDSNYMQYHQLIDPDKVITHFPIWYFPVPSEGIYAVKPPQYSFKQKLATNTGNVLLTQLHPENLDIKVGSYLYPYEFRIANDLFINSKKLIVSNKNVPPINFDVLAAQRLTENNQNYFLIDFTNSVDINGNSFTIDNQPYMGVRYGYELYEKGKLVETKLILNNLTVPLENTSNRIKIKGFKIPLGTVKYADASFKIFALDNQDDKIKTYGTISSFISNLIFCSTISAPTITVESNGSLISSALDGNQWYVDGKLIDNATQRSYFPTKSGNYTVKVTGACESDFSKAYNFIVTAVEEKFTYVVVSPNPFSNHFKVNFSSEFGQSVQLNVLDPLGKSHYMKQFVLNGDSIDLSNSATGSYFFQFKSNDNSKIQVVKVLKN